MTTETLDKLEKQIDKIDAAILKHTEALNNHDMARRAVTPIEGRNELAGDVYKSRQDLELILSTAREEIQAEREGVESRADDLVLSLQRIREWCDAYPVDIFAEPTAEEVKVGVDALQSTGVISSDRLHASWARHILKGVRGYTDIIGEQHTT